MRYRNKKRKAAISILEIIKKHRKSHITGSTTYEGGHTDEDKDQKDSYLLTDLQKKLDCDKELIKDAVRYLKSAGYIVMADKNQEDYFKQRIIITDEGLIALSDEFISDEIETYNSNLYYQYFRWVLPLAAIAIAIISLIATTCNKSTPTMNIQHIVNQPQQSDSLTNKVTQQKTTEHPAEKVDTSHAKIGQ